MINFALPGLYDHFGMYKILFAMKNDHPEYFNDNINIEALYGIFPFCIWDGGRIYTHYTQASIEQIEEIKNFCNDNHVALRLVFTNTELQSDDYLDHFGNIILQVCESENNQIVINKDDFITYIHKNYPKYKFISSTTKCLNKQEFKEELKKDYFSEICLDYNLNINMELLKGLTADEKDKCEFLVNAVCPSGCPTRKQHYKLNSLYHLNYGKDYTVPYCGITNANLHPKTQKYKNNISFEEIKNIYEPLGFTHFKIEGRTFKTLDLAANVVNYLVKPEYQLYVVTQLVN